MAPIHGIKYVFFAQGKKGLLFFWPSYDIYSYHNLIVTIYSAEILGFLVACDAPKGSVCVAVVLLCSPYCCTLQYGLEMPR